MPFLAGNRITMQTDTGGGNPDKANNKNVVYTSPYKTTKATTTTKATNPVTSTAKNTTAAKTATTSAANQNTSTAKKKYYTYSRNYSSGYSGGNYRSGGSSATEQPKTYWNDYLRGLEDTFKNEYNTITSNANSYKQAALQNIAASENQYNNAYNTNKAALDALAAQNAQREQATMNAINSAYNAIMGNANDYYNSLLDTYNRSMGYIDQGFNEGNEATAMARDEAIDLAAQLYAMGEESQNRETEKALKSQYASYMKGMRNLNQRLAAQGINGGATESSMLNALNGYESNRTDLNEAKLAALGALRQTQMQSDSEAQQAYLSKVADLIANRTNQQLGVEQNRSTGEYNYAGMKNSAESDRSNQTVSAQNNFQNWASNLVNQRSTNENAYADALRQIMESKNTAEYNSANMNNQAAANQSANYTSSAYQAGIENGAKAKKTKEKEKKKKEKEKKTAKKTTTKKK